jgi:hypothetical protein
VLLGLIKCIPTPGSAQAARIPAIRGLPKCSRRGGAFDMVVVCNYTKAVILIEIEVH